MRGLRHKPNPERIETMTENRRENCRLRMSILVIFLVICLMITGCAESPNTGDDSGRQPTGSESAAEKGKPEYLGMTVSDFNELVDLSCISIRLTATADVTLYLDSSGQTRAAECHNSETISLLEKVQMIEMEFDSVLFAVITHMTAKEYLTENTRLMIDITMEEGTGFPIYDVIDQMVENIEKDLSFRIGINMSSNTGNVGAVIQGGGITDNQVGATRDDQVGETGDDQYLEIERDQDGKLVRTLEEDPEGNRIERYYSPEGWIICEIFTGMDGLWREQYFSAENKLIKEQRVQSDGTELTEEYYENGEMKSRTSMNSDGVYEFEMYREDGTLATHLQENPDGSKVEIIMNEKGICLQIIEIDSIGNRSEITHDEKGDPVYERQTSPEGTVREITREFNSDHVLIGLSSFCSDGTTREERYDDRGKLVSTKEVSGNGDIGESRYNAQGMVIWEYILRTDGYQSEMTFSDSGKPLVENAVYPDGRKAQCIREYDEKDLLIKENWTYGDGSTSEIYYYANGRRKSCVNHLDNGNIETWQYSEDGTTGTMIGVSGTRVETYYPNGSIKKVTFTTLPSAGLDFTYEESTYDENGTMLTHTKIQNNGIIGVSTYHYDKSHTTVFTYPGGGGHTEYWYGNNLLGGIDSNGNPWGTTVPGADYSGLEYGGTIGKG